MPSLGLTRRRAVGGLATTVIAVAVLAGCGGASDRQDPRDAARDEHRAPVSEARLDDAEPGRLLRILGDGSASMLNGPAAANGSSVASPMALLARSDGDLAGVQGGFSAASQLFTVSSSARADTYGGSGGAAPASGYSLALAEVGDRLVRVGQDTVEVLDPATGDVVGAVSVPKNPTTPWSAAVLPTSDDATRLLQVGPRWFTLDLGDATSPRLTGRKAPVAGALAAAPLEGGGALVLTDSAIVPLTDDGSAGRAVPYRMPAEVADSTVTSAVALPGGGLVVTTGLPPDGGQGHVLVISSDGAVRTLVDGERPPATGSDCDDADTPTDDAHLSLPMSVALWQDRVVVADVACNAVLQLPLP